MELENLNLNVVLEQVGKEKNIDKKVLIDALEAAMLTAARKKLGLTADLQATFDETLGAVARLRVQEGRERRVERVRRDLVRGRQEARPDARLKK